MVEASLLRISEACLEAPLCESPWTHVAEAIAREFDGIAVSLSLAPGWSPQDPSFSSGIDRDALQSVAAYYHRLNPWARVSTYYPEGYFGSGFEMISPAELRKTEFYADWIRPAGLSGELVFGGLPVIRRGADELLVALFGERGAPEPTPAQLEVGRRMLPHLKRTFLVLELLQATNAQHETEAAIERARSRAGLTTRQCEVLCLIAKGLTYAECAHVLEIRPETVKAHVKAFYRKLEISSRAEAAREAMLLGLID